MNIWKVSLDGKFFLCSIVALLISGSGILIAVTDWCLGMFTVAIPVLMTTVITALCCRIRTTNGKRLSKAALFACPFLVSSAVLLSCAMGADGMAVFTSAYWSGYRLGPRFMFTLYGSLFTLCVIPALGVAAYHIWQSKRELQRAD